MEHLFADWAKVSRQLKEARHILLLADYDGTLTPIVERPELAELPEETRRVLRTLAAQRRFTVGIISGRSLSDLQGKVRLENIIYAGNHGMEIEGPGLSYVSPLARELRPVLQLIHRVLSKVLSTIRGVLVEDKGLTLSVHYRMVPPEKAGEVKTTVEQVCGQAQAAGKVRLTQGKKVYEVRPAIDWHKGKTLELLIEKYGQQYGQPLVIYLGDDLSDEDGFQAIEDYGNGISVFIGEERGVSRARYFLRSPSEVSEALNRLSQIALRTH